MSLLEDVFLEDEAGEAQELERVIEGDEFDERPRTPNSDENSEKEDEAEEDKRRVDHTAKAKRVVKNPRFILNPARLTGPRGIQVLPEHFKDFKFKGKGHEREDLDLLLKKLEHWAYRLYPKFKFDDCLKKIETLGKKRPVMVHLHKIRTDQFMSEETVVQKDSSGDEADTAPVQEEDEFDRLLQQQIELARSTPAPGSVRKEAYTPITPVVNRSPLLAPKISSSPSISDEQKERMMRNRKLAEERRLAKLNQVNNTSVSNLGNHSTSNEASIQENDTEKTNDKINDSIADDVDKDDSEITVRKHNRSNVIDSSDEDDDVMAGNKSITDDVHDTVQEKDAEKTNDKVKDSIAVDEDKYDSVVTVRKHHRSNLIDSSDEDDDVMAVNKSITVDVHDTVQENDTGNTNDKVNDSINVDVDKDDTEVTVRKPNRSNVIDSSDDDDDVMAVNESITVDVHDTANNVGHDTDSDTRNTEINIETTSKVIEEHVNSVDGEIEMDTEPSESFTDAVTEIVLNENKTKETFSDDPVTLDKDTNRQNVGAEYLNYEIINKNNVNCADSPILPDNKHNDEASTKEKVKPDKDESPQKEKEEVPATEDLMDVDFSDDF